MTPVILAPHRSGGPGASAAGDTLPVMDTTNPPGGAWRIPDVAAHLGVVESTVRAYSSRKQMPDADGTDRYGPWWYPATITGWKRPGPGNRTGPRGRRTANAQDLTDAQRVELGDDSDLVAWAARVRALVERDQASLAAIARAYGVTASTVSQRLRRHR